MTAPGIGDIIYLASALFRVRVLAQSTAPDTPNQYSADLKIMGDQGEFSLDAIAGPPGNPGQQTFAFREQDNADVNAPKDLPTNLTNTAEDIGKYWLIDTLAADGEVTSEIAWTWYGTGWRQFTMGAFGPPGPVPEITVEEFVIPPDETAYVNTSANTLQPTWELYLPQPPGPYGPISALYNFPDVDEKSVPPAKEDLLIYDRDSQGNLAWRPFSIANLLPTPWTMPESAFSPYTGVSQYAPIGSFDIPPQPFDWTPVVWGHLGGTGTSFIGTLVADAQNLLNILPGTNGGTFTLTFPGFGTTPPATTPPLPFNIDPAGIISALENLANVGIGNVEAILQSAGNTAITFVNALGGQALDPLIIDATQLLPQGIGNALTSVISTGGGSVLSNAQHLLDLTGATGGTFNLSFGGFTTPQLPFNILPSGIQQVLQQLPSIGLGNIMSFLDPILGFGNNLIHFIGNLGQQILSPLEGDFSQLIGGASNILGGLTHLADQILAPINSGGSPLTQAANLLSGDPLLIGCQVLLGDAVSVANGGTGIQVARGLGSLLGRVVIVPHYSNANNKNAVLTPTNNYAVVPAGQGATVYINLWNDGMMGVYNYQTSGSQLYIQAMPVDLMREFS